MHAQNVCHYVLFMLYIVTGYVESVDFTTILGIATEELLEGLTMWLNINEACCPGWDLSLTLQIRLSAHSHQGSAAGRGGSFPPNFTTSSHKCLILERTLTIKKTDTYLVLSEWYFPPNSKLYPDYSVWFSALTLQQLVYTIFKSMP